MEINNKKKKGLEVAGIGEVIDGAHHVMLQKQPKRMDGRLTGRSDTRTERGLYLFVVYMCLRLILSLYFYILNNEVIYFKEIYVILMLIFNCFLCCKQHHIHDYITTNRILLFTHQQLCTVFAEKIKLHRI